MQNSLEPAGLPPHSLKLKGGCRIILLINLDPPRLCNGTRQQVTALKKFTIEAKIITRVSEGETVFIPRIPLMPSDFPIQFKRLQFPIKAAFAMTINKSQRQTLKVVGVDLENDVFSHGQLYVALSRTGDSSNLYIHCPQHETRNVVYKEIW